jgi:hypothetical protein
VAGRTVIVWIDGSGRPVAAPRQHSDVAGQVILATALALAALTLVALILVLVAARVLAHVMLDRRRPAAWNGEWAAADLAVRGAAAPGRPWHTAGAPVRLGLGKGVSQSPAGPQPGSRERKLIGPLLPVPLSPLAAAFLGLAASGLAPVWAADRESSRSQRGRRRARPALPMPRS